MHVNPDKKMVFNKRWLFGNQNGVAVHWNALACRQWQCLYYWCVCSIFLSTARSWKGRLKLSPFPSCRKGWANFFEVESGSRKMWGKRRCFSPEIYVGCGLVKNTQTNETEVILLGYPRYPNFQNFKQQKGKIGWFPTFRSGSSFTGKLLLSGDPSNTWYNFEPLTKFTPLVELAWQQDNYHIASKG